MYSKHGLVPNVTNRFLTDQCTVDTSLNTVNSNLSNIIMWRGKNGGRKSLSP